MSDFLLERHGEYAWVRFNRPQKANALNVAMMEGVARIIDDAARDDGIRAILITGSGDRVFCAGVDVREQPADGDVLAHKARRGKALGMLVDSIMDSPKPVIAVLNGIASGGGAMVALVSDARVAVESASISLPEIDLGMPTFTGAAIVRHLCDTALATDLVQTGRRMPAAEATARGLFNAVATAAELESVAAAMAESLGAKPNAAFSANKQWLLRDLRTALDAARVASAGHRERTHAAGH